MTPFAASRSKWWLYAIVAGGVAFRVLVVGTSDGDVFDIRNMEHVLLALRQDGSYVFEHTTRVQWPYPSGYFPWLRVEGLATHLFPFTVIHRLSATVADAGLMLLVQDLLGRAGRPDRVRLAAAGVLAFGPLSVYAGGWFGQIDEQAAIVCVLALWVWTRPGQRRRAATAGALIGYAAAIKTVPLLLVIPFAAAARTRREAVVVATAAAVVVAVFMVPFALSTPGAVADLGGYHGVPAVGGLGLVTAPTFAASVLIGKPHEVTDWIQFLYDDATALVLGPALLVLAVLLFRRRPDVLTGICLTWLVVYAFGVNFSITYLGWGLPFFLIRGHLRAVLLIELAATPMVFLLTRTFRPGLLGIHVFYTAVMIGLWLASVAYLAYGVAGGRGDPVAEADSPGPTAPAKPFSA